MSFPSSSNGPGFSAWGRATPVLAPLLRERIWSFVIGGIAVAHLSLAGAGLGGLGCTIRKLTGVRCPGCGLTTASLDFFHGEWRAGFAHHAFAPVFLLAIGVVLLGALLPKPPRLALARWVEWGEQRSGAAFWLSAALLTYWVIRLSAA